MSITSQPSAAHVDPASRPAGCAPIVLLPVTAPEEPVEARFRALLAEVRATADDAGSDDPGTDETTVDDLWNDDDEFAAQDLALAAESADLRARAGELVSVGGTADEVAVVLRAFRSYEPFLGERDRALNAVAHQRLAAATTGHYQAA